MATFETLKTPESRFDSITDFPYKPHYVDFDGIDMHYIDEGNPKGEVVLALHGEPSWSYLYRKFVPILQHYRFIAPDLIGFGKSDKIVGWRNYNFQLHLKSLKNLIDKLSLNDITLVVQDWGGLLGLSLLGAYPERFKRVVVLNTFLPIGKPLSPFFKVWQAFARFHPSLPVGQIIQMGTYAKQSKAILDAYNAPFPSRKYKDGARAFPPMVPSKPHHNGVEEMKNARKVLSEWNKPALVIFSDKDNILGGLKNFFYKLIPTSTNQKKITIKDAGHFLQEEKGEEIAQYIDQFILGKLEVNTE